jgi:hypothetical protein
LRRLVGIIAISACLLLLAGCGDDEAAPTGGGDATTFEITFSGGTVSPNGAEETIDQGTDIELVVEADQPGELHVHSSPEQTLEYGAGTTTIPVTLSNEAPGVVDIESHDLDQIVIRLTIR